MIFSFLSVSDEYSMIPMIVLKMEKEIFKKLVSLPGIKRKRFIKKRGYSF